MDQPQQKQQEALLRLSNVLILGYGGAKGGGKSWLMRYWMLLRRLKYPKTHGIIIRKTYQELLSTHIKKILEEYPVLRDYYNKSEKVISLPNGSSIAFGYLQHSDDVYQYQGGEYEDIGLDEATQHSEEVFKVLRTSCRTTKKEITPKMLLTFNPGGIGHGWVKRLFIDKVYTDNEEGNDFDFVQALVYDNKILLDGDPNYIKALQALDPKKRKAYLDGDWDQFEGQFFEAWKGDVHVLEPAFDLADIPSNFEMRLAWDDGTTNPRAVHLMIQDNDGRVTIVWEYYKAGETIEEAAMNIKRNLQDLKIYDMVVKHAKFIYDPSMDIRNNQTGIASSTVVANLLGGIVKQRGNNERLEGARRYRSYLHWNPFQEPLMKIWSTCPNLIRTLPELVYDENRPEDIDSDGEDHCYDASRYGLMSFTKLPTRLGTNQEKKGNKNKSAVKILYKPLGGY